MNSLIKVDPANRYNDCVFNGTPFTTSTDVKNFRNSMITGEPNDMDTRYQANFYSSIAVDIVSETVLDYPYAYITEKTLRAFACKRMLIVLGAPGTLKLLHTMGFQTFPDLIDETYDDIQDPLKRFKSVVDEVHKICNTSLNVLKTYMQTNVHKFESNFLTLRNLQQTELLKIAQEHSIKI